ncbi:MAG: lactonase family protein [Eggerthellaceae bacterium]|nr:lactonase family protein [Eggerthellaceae bacterium]
MDGSHRLASNTTQNRRSAQLLVGTYTQSTASMGIYSVGFNPHSTALAVTHTITRNPNPSFLELRNPLLFAAQEQGSAGAAAVYLLNGDGSLSHLGSAIDASSAGTCHVAAHPSGRWLYGANYESGTLSCWPVRLDGRLGPVHITVRHHGSGPNAHRQNAPHIHSASFVPGTDLLAVTDLGTDTVTIYHAPLKDGLLPDPASIVRTPQGFGARILAFHPTLDIAALVGELTNRVLLYRLEQGGRSWTPYAQRDLPALTGARNKAAHVAFSPDGSRLYASARGRNVISVIRLDGEGQPIGQSCFPSGGKSPRHFSLSPCGRYLAVANVASNNVTMLRLLPDDSAQEVGRIAIPQPSCVIWA